MFTVSALTWKFHEQKHVILYLVFFIHHNLYRNGNYTPGSQYQVYHLVADMCSEKHETQLKLINEY